MSETAATQLKGADIVDGWVVYPDAKAFRIAVGQTPPRDYGLIDQVRRDLSVMRGRILYTVVLGLIGSGAAFGRIEFVLYGVIMAVFFGRGFLRSMRLARHGQVFEATTQDLKGPTFHELGLATVAIPEKLAGRARTDMADVPVHWKHCRDVLDRHGRARLLVLFDAKDPSGSSIAIGLRAPDSERD